MKGHLVFISISCCVLFSPACKQGAGRISHHYVKSHWTAHDPNADNPLKGRPTGVIDSIYGEKEENAPDSTSKFLEYDRYTFDRDGALICRKIFFTDTFWNETLIRYDDSGYNNAIVWHSGSPDKRPDTILVSDQRVQTDGRYKKTRFDLKGHPTHISFVTYLSEGRVIKEELLEDTSKEAGISSTVINVYDGDRVSKVSVRRKDGDLASSDYFYSPRGFLDSTVSRSNGKLNVRYVFVNNEQGDHLRRIELSPAGDTLESYTWKYQYDKEDNWIKRWERHGFSKRPYGNYGEKDYPVTLTIRNLVY